MQPKTMGAVTEFQLKKRLTLSKPPYIVIEIFKKFIYTFNFVSLLFTAKMSMVSFAFGIIISNNSFTFYNVNKRIFIAMRFVRRRLHLPYFNFYNIAIVFFKFVMFQKTTFH